MYLCISARNRGLASFWANKELGWFAYFVLGRLNKGAYHSVVYKRVHAHNNRTRREKENQRKINDTRNNCYFYSTFMSVYTGILRF